MITHQIIVYHRPAKTTVTVGKQKYPKFTGVQGSHEHRAYLLKRACYFNPFETYDEVVFRKKKYLVTEVIGPENYRYVTWDGLSPKFIEILSKDGEYTYVNASELKKARR